MYICISISNGCAQIHIRMHAGTDASYMHAVMRACEHKHHIFMARTGSMTSESKNITIIKSKRVNMRVRVHTHIHCLSLCTCICACICVHPRMQMRTCIRIYLRLSHTLTLPRACVPYSGEHVHRRRGGAGIFSGGEGGT
jgi:hypothetical protein